MIAITTMHTTATMSQPRKRDPLVGLAGAIERALHGATLLADSRRVNVEPAGDV
jgi:hypothetical protein